jgi:hypothetical protein
VLEKPVSFICFKFEERTAKEIPASIESLHPLYIQIPFVDRFHEDLSLLQPEIEEAQKLWNLSNENLGEIVCI